MTDTKLDFNESHILDYDIADEALEAAAGAGPTVGGAFTIAMCTGQAECPY